MPIYEYRCESCGHELERLQKMSDDPLKDCPECGASALRKVISPVGFRLKGSGWYETDFKKDNKRNLVDSDSSTKSTKKTESKSKSKDSSSTSSSGSSSSSKSASAD